MVSSANNRPVLFPAEALDERVGKAQAEGAEDGKLRRWQISFRSGTEWYPVGEYIAVHAPAAIDRAVAIFGAADDYLAEEIPWDAAPLPRMDPRAARPMS